MPSLHVVIIWLLSITFGGLMITMAFLYATRDTGQRALPRPLRRRSDTIIIKHYLARTQAAFERSEAASGQLGPVPPGQQSTTLACAGVGHRLCDGRQHISPTETRPCACHCHRPPVAIARPPAVDEATAATLTRALIDAGVRRYYAQAGERQTQALLDAGASAWH